jgi:hypothetical protein
LYITSETTFAQAGVGGPGFGQLVASAALQNIVVTVTTLTTVSGGPTIGLDLLLGDNQNPNLSPNLDASWAANAVATGITVPLTAGQSASATVLVNGCARGARLNVAWGTPGGSFKVQLSARDQA